MPAVAQPLVIDDFESGPFAVADSSLTPPVITTGEQSGIDSSHVLGGVRLVSVQATAADVATATFAPASDPADDGALLTAASGGRVLFQYDAVASPELTAAGSAGALGLDLSDFSRIVVTASGVTGTGATARVLLWGAGGPVAGSAVPLVEGANSLPLSGFSAAELSDVRQLDVEIDGISPTSSLRVMDVSALTGTLRHVGSGTCGGNSPCHATTQAAVDAAEPGDTVRVQAGSYPELVRITAKTDLMLEGDPASPPGSAVIEPADGGLAECMAGTAAVEVESSSGVTLQRLAIAGYDGTGVRLRGASQANSEVQILGLRITGTGSAECGAGILVEEPNAQTLLAHNAIVGNAHDGVAFSGMPPLGTSVPQYLWSNTIVGNGRHGVVVSGFERPSLWNNLIAGNGAQTSNAQPAYGVARELAGLLAPLADSQITLRHNLVCGNRSGELSLAPTETPDGDSEGNLTPTGSEGTTFTASPDCGDPETLFAVGAGPDTFWGTDDDDYFLAASSPAVDAGDGAPTPEIADLATLQSDFRRGTVRPADGDGDGGFDYDIGALEYGVAPTVAISDPTDDFLTSETPIDVSGTFTGTAPLSIIVNGAAATLSGSSFASSADLAEGANTVTATATNAFGSASQEVAVTLDTTDPAVAITSPSDGTRTAAPSIAVSGTVSDANPPESVRIAGQSFALENGAFSGEASLTLGDNTIEVLATDLAGHEGSDTVSVFRGQVPTVSITSPAPGTVVSSSTVVVSGTVAGLPLPTVVVNGVAATMNEAAFSATVPRSGSGNSFTAIATNEFGSASDTVTVTLGPLEVAIQSPADETVTTASSITVSGTISDSVASVSVNGVAATVSGYSFSAAEVPLQLLTNTITATATRGATTDTDERTVIRSSTPPPAAAPSAAAIAPARDASEASAFGDAVSFLYSGPNAIQSPAANAIDETRIAVVRGRILRRNESPLGGVAVSVLGQSQLGTTHSQADGSYDIVVNGGSGLTIHYQLPGYISAQRQVNAPWRDYAIVDDLVMLPLDRVATTIQLSSPPSPIQVARGTVSSDADGTRQATALFAAGTAARLRMRDGTLGSPLGALTVRLSEFTVGPTGPQTMPASLPPTSGYTYAVELSADEAFNDPNAVSVQLENHPVVIYLENFLDIPVGKVVPVGTYDYQRATWLPDPNGQVIRIDSIDGGLAVVSPAMTLSADERAALASLYGPGQELWRIETTHFSPADGNYPWKYPDGADGPPFNGVKGQSPSLCDPSVVHGSVIECETQVLGEQIDLAGVPFSLHYRSSRTPGYAANRTVKIPITGVTRPAPLQRVDVQVDVAGKRSSFTFPNTAGQPEFPFTWDGKDAYGRSVQGATPGTVRIGYVYQAEIGEPWESLRSFGEPATTRMQIAARGDAIAWRDYPTTLTSLDARGFGIAGWTLSPHHFYDHVSQTLYRGNGRSQKLSAMAPVIWQLSGQQTTFPGATTGVPGPVSAAIFGGTFSGAAAAPDGSLYLAQNNSSTYDRLYKVDRTGYVMGVTASGSANSVTPIGGLASATVLSGNIADIAVGRDGSVYFAEAKQWYSYSPTAGRILRINPVDGKIEQVAGAIGNLSSDPCSSGTDPMVGEGGLSNAAPLCLYLTSELDTGPDGSVYFSRPSGAGAATIRRVKPDGKLETIVLSQTGNPSTVNGGLARQLPNNSIRHFTVDDEGRVYFSRLDGSAIGIYAVRPEDSVVQRVAGGGNPADQIGDGLPALQAKFRADFELAAGPDGRIYVVDEVLGGNHPRAVRAFVPGGLVQRVAGNGTVGATGSGGAAIQAPLALDVTLAAAPDGVLYLAESALPYPAHVNQVRTVGPPVPLDPDEISVPSEGGSEVYDFDEAGRHLRTRSARTGAKLLTFCYNGDGRLTKIREVAPANIAGDDCTIGSDDRVTTVEWNGSNPTAIVGSFGARSELAVDTNGHLSSVSDPLDHAHTLASTASGLLTRFTPPEGGDHVFTYDSLGLLTRDEDPEGGFKELTRADVGDRVEIDIETALGRLETKALEPSGSGVLARFFTDPAGLVTELFQNPGDSSSSETPDGTDVDVIYGPDPRFGTVAPIAKQEQIKTPANLTRVRTHARTASVNAGNLVSQTDTLTLNNRTTTIAYTGGSTRKETTTSPVGRKVEQLFDTQERVTQAQLIGVEAVRFGYDSGGRLTSTSQGQGTAERTTTFGYGADGYLASVTDDLSRTTSFEYDDAGRLERTVLPDLREIAYTWDDNGNLASLTPPGQPAHVFRYTSLDQESEYEPPAIDANDPRTVFTYNLDRDLTRIDRADGGAVVLGYDGAGRVSSVQTARGTIQPTYSTTTGNVTNLAAPAGEGSAYIYDGRLPKRTTWSGTVAGYVEHGYDSDFRVSTENVNGTSSVTFGYDADSLLTSAGSLSLTRHAQTGLVTGTSLGTVATTLGYNGFGEVTSESATVSSNPVYATTFTRDDLGRITQKVETVQGVTTTYDYRFDTAGRLDQVKHDGVVARSYTYDDNGNRLSVGTTSGTYDDQDRILTYGSTSYVHDAAGDLTSKTSVSGTTQYTYDELGNLSQVTLPNSTTITYPIDGQNRRIGKRVNGTLVKGWLYQDQLEPVAELDGSGAVISRFVYGSKANVPGYMVQGSTTYRILSDHLGSVRLVVNTADGTVAQRIDYDEFGNITSDTNPGFQPFGFAGGLYDAETGLTRFGARDYDPVIGRWTTKDPIRFGGGLNLYGYVMADPVNMVDPNGLAFAVAGFNANAVAGGGGGASVGAYIGWHQGADADQGWFGTPFDAGFFVTPEVSSGVDAGVGAFVGGVKSLTGYSGNVNASASWAQLSAFFTPCIPDDSSKVNSFSDFLSAAFGQFNGGIVGVNVGTPAGLTVGVSHTSTTTQAVRGVAKSLGF